MSIKFSLLYRIIAGIILFSLIFILFLTILVRQINKNEQLTIEINNNYQPSVSYLSELLDLYSESRNLFHLWGVSDISNDSLFRNEIRNLFQSRMISHLDELTRLSVKWDSDEKDLFYLTSQLLLDSLYLSYTDLIAEIRTDKKIFLKTTTIKTYLEKGNIFLLQSKIEKNLNYLLGKRRLEMNNYSERVRDSYSVINKTVAGFTILIILILVMVSYFTLIYTNKSLNKFTANIKMLTQGIIPGRISPKYDDEFGKVFNLLNNFFDYLKNLTRVSQRILQKDFNTEFTPLSENDELGIALRDLQNDLKSASVEEQRYNKEDSERRWISEGIARINEILRTSSDKLEDLSYNLIKEIVEYTFSKVGGLYVLNNTEPEDPFIELLAAYAYERKKYLTKKILVGEGLVGRCVQENETIFLTDVPKDYLTIKSGMGESKPVSILISPIRLNENVFGVIEIATFIKLEPYQIQFIETIGESIATTISKAKINLQTTQLLAQTRMQAEEMSAQEEEMRQNMEELRVTQEQMAIREEKLKKEIEILKQQLKTKK